MISYFMGTIIIKDISVNHQKHNLFREVDFIKYLLTINQ